MENSSVKEGIPREQKTEQSKPQEATGRKKYAPSVDQDATWIKIG